MTPLTMTMTLDLNQLKIIVVEHILQKIITTTAKMNLKQQIHNDTHWVQNIQKKRQKQKSNIFVPDLYSNAYIYDTKHINKHVFVLGTFYVRVPIDYLLFRYLLSKQLPTLTLYKITIYGPMMYHVFIRTGYIL